MGIDRIWLGVIGLGVFLGGWGLCRMARVLEHLERVLRVVNIDRVRPEGREGAEDE